jgi:glycosyltransferase involved in cell wall biosynthesis
VSAPRVSVVVATRNRCQRLVALLASLGEQTLRDFEVIVVDDGSTDATAAVLATLEGVRVLRHEASLGPAAARNAGWRAARAPIVAFTDDDCRAAPEWLEAGVREVEAAGGGVVVQGRVEKDPEQLDALTPFAHWYEVHDANQGFPTCNIFYERALLERLGGFDEETFKRAAGEDTDLGWRAVEAGASVVFAPNALVWHGIVPIGPMARLRATQRWTDTIVNYRRHPGLKPYRGVFWRHNHYELARFLIALALPRRLGPLRLFLAAPYVKYLTDRRTGPLLAPYLLTLDLAEVLAIVRGAIRHRVLVI